MILLQIIFRSLLNRKLSITLTILTLALSVALFLSVNRLHESAKSSFQNSISGVDIILGARGDPVQILLASVFHIGSASNNIKMSSLENFRNHPAVDWAIPISLGDSHKGFRVVGTTDAFFHKISVANAQKLHFAKGSPFSDLFDVVVGAQVAAKLDYNPSDKLVIAHGITDIGTALHDDLPFQISGILAPTGTPLDRSLFVSLEALEAIHKGWKSGARLKNNNANTLRTQNLTPKNITAGFIGVKSPIQIFKLQRQINRYRPEPLTAVLPGIALSQLWQLVTGADQVFQIITALIIAVALLGMVAMTVAGLNERRREMAILRSVGASPSIIAGLMLVEAFILAILAIFLGIAMMFVMLGTGVSVIREEFGLVLTISPLALSEIATLCGFILTTLLAALLPAWRVYRTSLHDGMSVKR